MNRIATIAALLPLTLWAAEVWESKPFQDWSDKDLQRVMSRSPWARESRATFANSRAAKSSPSIAAGDPSPGNIGGARGIGGDPGGSPPSPTNPAGGFGGLGNGQPQLAQGTEPLPQSSSLPVTVRWQMALPIRQAFMRAKYGKEAVSSPEARKYLEQESKLYLIAVSGLPGAVVSGGAGDQAKERIEKTATLKPNGKPPILPLAVEFIPSGGGVDVLIAFPRSAGIAVEDQEVEFAGQIGAVAVKQKFRLKDMVFKGKLEL